jgi:Fe-S oxidoreductase
MGQPTDRIDQPLRRIGLLIQNALFQQRTLRERYAGIFHGMIFWGFLVLLAATTVVMLDHDFRLPLMRGAFYLYFQSLFVDVLGLLFLIGIALAAFRRGVLRPQKLVYTSESLWILLALFVLGASGFLLEGWRIAATDDPWGAWSPVGYLVAKLSAVLPTDTIRILHRVTWWFHLLLTFVCIAWAPYTKMAHLLFSPLNIYTASLKPTGASLKSIDFETSETFGVNQIAQFTWKDLLDLDACTECGRCTAACPANASGKPLSPRDVILDLQDLMHREESGPLVGGAPALSAEALWSCTTCAACVEACPVSIEQLPKIIDMRRHLVMDEADFPEMMQGALESIENRGHPFRGTPCSRDDWAEGLSIPEWKDGESYDVLYWVGCAGGLVERNQRTVRATAKLLQKAGVRFAIMGRNEKCTGDLARRIGNEFLFETVAKENIEQLNARGAKKVVTSCPHCFNTIANEYPRLGGQYEVQHHSEFLADLVREGRLKPSRTIDESVTFHDPCYLGRHNGVYDAPRELVQLSIGKSPVEMPRSKSNSFCCGGGGGMSFVEEAKDQRVSHLRASEAVAAGTETVAVGCPFCMTMLEDAVKATAGENAPKVKDIAELLWQAVED